MSCNQVFIQVKPIINRVTWIFLFFLKKLSPVLILNQTGLISIYVYVKLLD